MKCPVCISSPLDPDTSFPIALADSVSQDEGLYRCKACEGHWANKSFIQILVEQHQDFKGFFENSLKSYNRDCPSCNVKLYESCFPKTQVLCDGCQTCHGFWFDNGEYEEILDRLGINKPPVSETTSDNTSGNNSLFQPQRLKKASSNDLKELFNDSVSFSIYQKKEMLEIISPIELMNNYEVTIIAPTNKYGKIKEHSKSIFNYVTATFLGHIRPATLTFTSEDGLVLLRMKKFFRIFFDRLDVFDHKNRTIGHIKRVFSIIRSNYIIQSQRGQTLMKIKGPIFFLPFFDHYFKITLRSQEVGRIQKKYSGFLKELFTEADNFECRVNRSLSADAKALIFCATVLIDFGSYEENQGYDFSFTDLID